MRGSSKEWWNILLKDVLDKIQRLKSIVWKIILLINSIHIRKIDRMEYCSNVQIGNNSI
jgi:hypothetical protein